MPSWGSAPWVSPTGGPWVTEAEGFGALTVLRKKLWACPVGNCGWRPVSKSDPLGPRTCCVGCACQALASPPAAPGFVGTRGCRASIPHKTSHSDAWNQTANSPCCTCHTSLCHLGRQALLAGAGRSVRRVDALLAGALGWWRRASQGWLGGAQRMVRGPPNPSHQSRPTIIQGVNKPGRSQQVYAAATRKKLGEDTNHGKRKRPRSRLLSPCALLLC